MHYLSLKSTEEEVKKRLREVEEYYYKYDTETAWELLSPLLDTRDSYSDSIAAIITLLGSMAKLYMKDKEQARILLEEGIERAKAAEAPSVEAFAYAIFGELLLKEEQPTEALEYCERAKTISEEIGEYPFHGYLHHVFANCFTSLGKLKKALSYEAQALRFYVSEDNKWAQLSSLNHIASLNYEKGQFQETITYARKAVSLADELNHSEAFMKSSLLEGVVLKRQGKLAKAKEYFQNAIQTFTDSQAEERPKGLLRGFSYNLANVHELLGEYEEAEAIYLELLKEEQETEEDLGLYGANGLGRLALAKGNLREAARYFEEGIAKIRSKKGKGLYLVETLVHLGKVSVELGDFEKARQLIDECGSYESESNYTKLVCQYGKGILAQAERNLRFAKESFERCLDLAVEVGLAEYRIKALIHLASLELYEYRISGSRDRIEKMSLILDDARAIALDSNMPILGLEIGVLRGLSCSARLDYDCAIAFLEESMNFAQELDLPDRKLEIQDLLSEIREERKRAAAMVNPETILADSSRLTEYISNLQNVIRSFGEERDIA